VTATLDFILTHPLTRDRPLRSIARYAAWQLGSRVVREHRHAWIGGSCLVVRNGMTGATGNIYCGLHEFVDMAFVLHMLRPGDLFLDIGANVGSYSVLAAAVCGADVLAFEPDPDTLVHLRRNIAANRLDERVVVHDAALGAQAGEAAFTVGLDSMNQVVEAADGPTRKVRMLPLDAVPRSSEAALMKLDVEGFEERVLSGAPRALASPALLAIETEGRSDAITAILNGHGFFETAYNPLTRILGGPPAFASSNALFVRDVEAVQARVRAAPRRRVLGRDL
jgi:FkbM family methyltransferase